MAFFQAGVRPASARRRRLAFPAQLAGSNTENLHLEMFLDSVFDLDLVGTTVDLEGPSVFLLLKQSSLFRHADGVDDW